MLSTVQETLNSELFIMRKIIAPFVLTCLLQTAASAQTRDTKALKPCGLLTPDVVKQVSVASKKSSDPAAPEEFDLGRGMICQWGEIMLQVDPVIPAQLEQLTKTVSGT